MLVSPNTGLFPKRGWAWAEQQEYGDAAKAAAAVNAAAAAVSTAIAAVKTEVLSHPLPRPHEARRRP